MHTAEQLRELALEVAEKGCGKAQAALMECADLLDGHPLLLKVLELADEYTNAIDLAEADIGGGRKPVDVLRELGPAVEAAIEHRQRAAEKQKARKG